MKYSMYLLAGSLGLSVVACSGGPGAPTYLNTGSREPVVDSRESGGSSGSGSATTTPRSPATGTDTPSNGNSGPGNSGNGSGNSGTDPGTSTPPNPTTQASCATLQACCPTLGDVEAQCNTLATSGSEEGCASALTSLQSNGQCN